MASLAGKVAIVTGASRGIGRAIALRLSQEGASVFINYARGAQQAKDVVSAIEAAGGKALAVQADVSKTAEIRDLFDRTQETYSQVDILVNNAGVILYKPVAEVTEAEFDNLFAINVKGTFFACQEAAKRMADGGRIVNFSSSTTAMLLPTYGVYVATKGAVEQLTRSLAKELGYRQNTVNVISPGPTDTELFTVGKTVEQIQRFTQITALGRLGKVEDIADVTAFLCSDQARWIIGQNICVNGGTA
ncbi:SDR family oxidoreductase [Microcoleus sp. Pol17_C1]|uniref:SDR family oxidoreductase n=1 Tax=unclassified Microcoleus TaxID=2642155 RepID=UPI002FCED919